MMTHVDVVMRIGVKVDARKARRRMDNWRRALSQEEQKGLQRWGRLAAGAAYKYTPGGTAQSAREISARIAEDLDPGEVDVRWFTLPGGKRKAVLWSDQQKQPGPFVAVKRTRENRAALDAIQSRPNAYGVRYVTAVRRELRQKGNYNLKLRRRVWRLSWHGARQATTEGRVLTEIRARQKKVGGMASGWNPLARAVGAPVPAAAGRVRGKGSAKTQKRGEAVAAVVAVNKKHYGNRGLSKLTARWVPVLRRKMRMDARTKLKPSLLRRMARR